MKTGNVLTAANRSYSVAAQTPPVLWRFAKRKPLGAIGGVIVVVMIIIAIIAPFTAPHDPYELNLIDKYAPPGGAIEDGKMFILGSDSLGRDILSRIMYGARISLYVGLLSVGLGVTLGAALGIVSGYLGGKVDLVVQRVVDAFMAFPALVFALGILAALGPSLNNVVLTLVLLFIPGSARVVRSQALAVKETIYVDAARAIGASDQRIIMRHVLPNCLAPYLVFATANLGLAIVIEASLTFLGVGTPIDVPSWGGMLSVAGAKYVEVAPWLLLFPSIAVVLAVFGFNLLGDALRDVLDPRLRGTQ